jgi:pimeloyl-ACP methyl ester carboxylesterase
MAEIEVRRIEVRPGLRLEYAARGSGPAVVFLHGYTDSWRSFEPVLERMPGDVRSLALTQRGHGDSDRPPSGYRIEDFAADVASFLDAAGIPDATVVGHSMGSLVAQEVAHRRPERVSSLVLVASATSLDNPVVRELAAGIRALRDPVPRDFVHAFQSSTVHRPIPGDLLDRAVSESLKVPARVWREALEGQLEYRTGDRLAGRTAPTRIVWGDRDEIFPRAEQDRLRGAIPGSDVLVYEETGHAVHWEQPQRFVDDLLAFLSSPAAARRGTRDSGASDVASRA